jgi:hypothetical protein
MGVVVVEALKVRNMSASARGTAEEPGRMVRQKSGLNRAILDQGWSAFKTMLAYKLADRGGRLVEVNAADTSQTSGDVSVSGLAGIRGASLSSARLWAWLLWGVVLAAGLVISLGVASRAGLLVVEYTLDPTEVVDGDHAFFDYRVGTMLTRLGLFVTGCDDIAGASRGALHAELALFEDGRPLGPAHSVDDSIRKTGGGAYSFQCLNRGATRSLGFSASDNSDPRSNGHQYRARYPIRMCSEALLGASALVVVLGLGRMLAWVYRGVGGLSVRELAVIAVAGMIAAVGWAVVQGQDVNWDQKNYHIYAPYALLYDRSHLDIAPGQVQTWSNPFPHIPYYLAIANLPPSLAGATMGALASLNFILVYLIGWQLFAGYSRARRHALTLPATVIGFTSATFLSEVGTTFVDNTACLPLLAGLALALRSLEIDDRDRRLPMMILGVGLLVGLAVGLKLTHILFLPGLAVGFMMCRRLRVTLLTLAPAGTLGFLLGFLIGDGYPAYLLWQQYHSPFFPYFNDWFKSPFYLQEAFSAITFIPKSLGEIFSILVLWTFDYGFYDSTQHCLQVFDQNWFCVTRSTSEGPFRDPRFLLITAALAVAAVGVAVRMIARLGKRLPTRPEGRARLFLLAFFLIGYALWMAVFAYQRYLVSLELIGGLVLGVAILAIFRNYRSRVVMLTLCAVLSVAWTRPSDWGHIPYGKSWFGLSVPAGLDAPDTLFVMVNGWAESYIVPFFPPTDRFVRLTGNIALTPGVGLGAIADQDFATHRGPLMVLAPIPPLSSKPADAFSDNDRKALERFRIDADFTHCTNFTSHVDTFTACPARHRP